MERKEKEKRKKRKERKEKNCTQIDGLENLCVCLDNCKLKRKRTVADKENRRQ